MTKDERMAILLWSEAINDEKQRCDDYFKQLQDMSKGCGLPVWCSARQNRDQLQGRGFADRAAYLYDQYIKANAKHDAMMSLVGKLSDVADDPLKDGGNGWLISRGQETRKEN